MKTVKERYLTDATFHYVVDSMRAILSSAQLTPSEVREAAMLACIIEEERSTSHVLSQMSDDEIVQFAARQQAETTRQLLRDSVAERGGAVDLHPELRMPKETKMNDQEPLDSRGKLFAKLRALREESDHEDAHVDADDALLDFINDEEIAKAFNAIEKWYA